MAWFQVYSRIRSTDLVTDPRLQPSEETSYLLWSRCFEVLCSYGSWRLTSHRLTSTSRLNQLHQWHGGLTNPGSGMSWASLQIAVRSPISLVILRNLIVVQEALMLHRAAIYHPFTQLIADSSKWSPRGELIPPIFKAVDCLQPPPSCCSFSRVTWSIYTRLRAQQKPFSSHSAFVNNDWILAAECSSPVRWISFCWGSSCDILCSDNSFSPHTAWDDYQYWRLDSFLTLLSLIDSPAALMATSSTSFLSWGSISMPHGIGASKLLNRESYRETETTLQEPATSEIMVKLTYKSLNPYVKFFNILNTKDRYIVSQPLQTKSLLINTSNTNVNSYFSTTPNVQIKSMRHCTPT